MKKNRRILFMPLCLLYVLIFTGCGVLAEAGKLEQYEMGKDVIPSITSVVGERAVTGVKTSIDGGVATKQYSYTSDSVYDDLLAYITKLMDEGWLVTQDIDLNVVPGSGELGKESSEEGKILLVSFSYDESGYEIKISKGEGTIE
ncbi:MAG: hypothetical protein BWY46_01269 [Firmicutes bacterium ADurb.Bin300]|nr:MAG: hypothetical protein BWY46_01269 [Firmicutes bacterium ADurb.Bin300]